MRKVRVKAALALIAFITIFLVYLSAFYSFSQCLRFFHKLNLETMSVHLKRHPEILTTAGTQSEQIVQD